MLAYLGFGRLPHLGSPAEPGLVARYAERVHAAVVDGCDRRGIPLPRLVLEPGRAMVSDSQVLLLGVGHVRERPGVGAFALTDGGAMTVSMMFLSEVHAVFLASRSGDEARRVSVFGALPSPMDVVYRNLTLPTLRRGDVLAVMDAGAYFTSTATNFGGPRPGVLLWDGAELAWVRRPETYDDLLRLEVAAGPNRTDS
jgi:diaminopimelate decarboxylase